MSPSGAVITRFDHPGPASVVVVATTLAATSKSDALVVTAAGVLLVAVLPMAEAGTSTGLTAASPEYSGMRMSANSAAPLKGTLAAFTPAAAAAPLGASY